MEIENRIIIVDDDEYMRKTMKRIFKEEGYQTETAMTGHEALEKIREKYFNIVLLDIKLPDVEGTELLGPLKEMYPEIEVMMITAHANIESAINATNRGASAYIVKPLNIDNLLARVRNSVERQRLIAEKQQSEQKLKESEEKYRLLIENAQEGIWAIDENANTTFVNQRMAGILGYTVEEMLGKHLYCFMDEEGVKIAEQHLESRKQGIKEQHDFEFIRKDGTRIYTSIETSPILDDSRNYIGDLAFVADITKRKKAVQKLKESEEKYKNLSNEMEMILDHIPALVFYKDIENNFIRVNQRIADAHNMSKEELAGKNLFDLCPKAQAQAYWDDDLEVIKSGNPKLNIEEPWDTAEGKRWVSTSKIPFIDENGKITGIIGFSSDITERKHMEEKLRESENKYRILFEEAADSIFIIDADTGELVDFNTAAYSNLGYSYEEFKQIQLSDIDAIETPEEIKEHVEKVNREGNGNFETKHKTKDGKIKDIHVNTKPITIREKPFLISICCDITDRKKAEEEIKRAYSDLNQIFNVTIPLCVIDKNFNIIRINNTFSSLFLLKTEDIIRKKCYDTIPGHFCDTPECTMRQILGGRDMWEYEKTIELHNGIKNTYIMRAVPYVGNDGEIIGVFQSYMNISDRKKAEEKLKESEKKLKIFNEELDQKIVERTKELKKSEKFLANIFNSIQDGLCIIDKDFNIIRVNTTIEIWYSHKSPILEKKCYQMFHSRTEPCEDCIYFDVIKSGKPRLKVIPKRGKNDEIIGTLEIFTFPLQEQKTGVFTGLIEYIRDVTEQYKAEQELKESEEKSRNIINNISDVLLESNSDGNITYISHQIQAIIGYQPEELVGLNLEKFIHPDDLLPYKEVAKKALESKEPVSVECRVQHKKRYYVPISIKGSLVEINNEFKFFGVLSDNTERKKIENMIEREIKKLKELDQIRSDLIRRISHELNTPLNYILGGSEYLLDYSNVKIDNKIQEIVKIIHKGGNRLKDLVDNLLFAYNIESDDMKLNLKRENLIPIIKECIRKIVFQAEKRNIFLNLELLNELYLDVDKPKISRAISNILSNAVKNTLANGNVFIKTFEHHDYIDIIIKDTGVGFTKKEMPILFKKFGKIERFGKGLDVDIEGPGLGLYISNEIVKLHKGEILVKSKGRNNGATFTIRLYTN